MFNLAKIVLLVFLFGSSGIGQARSPAFEWDLSYEKLLKENSVGSTELIRLWLRKSPSPAGAWLAEINLPDVRSAVLIEFPAFHAGERTTILLFRTETEAFNWEFVEGGNWGRGEEPVKTNTFDSLLAEVAGWKQLRPKNSEELPKHTWPGYMGFLSYFDGKRSSQMLLTMDDFALCTRTTCPTGEAYLGRLLKALGPTLTLEESADYRHKTKSEILAMTPAERLNEYVKENNHHSRDFSDTQSMMIQKYLRLDGTQIFPDLIKLIESYNPRRRRDTSSTLAVMLANDIDGFAFRVRGSVEGRQLIDAIKEMESRMRAEKEGHTGITIFLKMLTETNIKDEAIGDALRLNHGVKFATGELADFVDFLIKVAPDYPSWSETKWVMNLRRNNEAGHQAQGPVVTNSQKYYKEFLKFRRGRVSQ